MEKADQIRLEMNSKDRFDKVGVLRGILIRYEVQNDIDFFRESIQWIKENFDIYSRIQILNGQKQIQEEAMFSIKYDTFNPVVTLRNAEKYLKIMNLNLDSLEQKIWYI